MEKPQFIEGGLAVDDRGTLSFVNAFTFQNVKRFYTVSNFSVDTIRAFHGHMRAAKYVYVASGSAIVAAVPLDSTEHPSKQQEISRFVLSARKPGVLVIPAGYANGFKVLEPNTTIFYFTTTTMEEDKGDDYRFPADYWGTDIWKVENR
jgi:dTDP-4-dehydrorhamnose 3,5-epimerase